MKQIDDMIWNAGLPLAAGILAGAGIGGLSFGAALLPAVLLLGGGIVLAVLTVVRQYWAMPDRRRVKIDASEPSQQQVTQRTETQISDPPPLFYSLDHERQIISGVLTGQVEEANLALREVLDKNLKVKTLSIPQRRDFCVMLRQTFLRLLEKLPGAEAWPQSALFDEQEEEPGTQQLYDQVLEVYETIVEHAQNEMLDQSGLMRDILKYIEENYNRDISLVEIAETFHITSYYVSRLFKNKAGINYKDYLNRYRVNKAKEMMRKDPFMRTVDLAEAVGFNNTDTFNRVFKSLEDITPGAYSRQARGQRRES